MSKNKFINRLSRKRKYLLFSLLAFILLLGIGFSNISMNLGIGGTLSFLGYKPTLTITLDNQSATTPGTTSIYEKYSVGYYLDNTLQIQMSTSNNSITIPEKTGYIFDGYYTGTNGSGTQYIDSTGKLTINASNTCFIINGTLYANWTRIMAENLGYTPPTGVSCTNTQCMIDYINGILN